MPLISIRCLCLLWNPLQRKEETRYRKVTWKAQNDLTALPQAILRFQAPKFPFFFSSSKVVMVHKLWERFLNRAELDKLIFHWSLRLTKLFSHKKGSKRTWTHMSLKYKKVKYRKQNKTRSHQCGSWFCDSVTAKTAKKYKTSQVHLKGLLGRKHLGYTWI